MRIGARPLAENCIDCEHRTLRLFCNLDQDALQRFDSMGVHVAFPSRTVVFEENQSGNGVFVVCSGQLKLSAISREGRTMILRLAGPGDVLGLGATLNDLPYEVTAETIEPTQLKNVRRGDFMQFLEEYSEVGEKTSKAMARQYNEVFLDARRLALSGSAAGKLAQLLLEWANSTACGKPELRFTMALTHEELANMAGTSRETVTRLLKQFERNSLITRHGASLTIVNPSGLRDLAQ
jgi:CRP/FNR family transcriptional regulator, cyclic AMP receptor protein